MTPERPTFRELTRAEAEAVLARNHVGRLAFVDEERHVDITPIHYVFAHGMVHGRTAAGTKLSAVAHRPWVAFETDEVEAAFRWRSVVVRGTISGWIRTTRQRSTPRRSSSSAAWCRPR